jgi:leader peptidase (prepilin peptidase)/N-methyltransferase
MLGSPAADAAVFALLGLLIGSFLNVVIYRLPQMMQAEWAANCAELAGQEPPAHAAFNLMRPPSGCPHCKHRIRWFENIPVLSYLALRGKCAHCGAPISIRYPAVELVTGALFAAVALHHGLTPSGLAWAAFASLLVAQFFIDFDTQLLPDDLNYLILWGGLLAALLHLTRVPISSAVWGAVLGYLSLWTIYQVHHLLTGKQGMGHGDFKLLAGLGAWFGSDYLIALILLSSVVGSVIGGTLLVVGRISHRDIPIPFGPFLAGAGLLAMALGPGRLESLVPFAFPLSHLVR